MIDLHSHVLPGLDDGARDVDEAIAMCRSAAADGIEVLAATPHVRFDHQTTPEAMETALAGLAAQVGSLIRLVPGGELDLRELDRPLEELKRFALAGNPRYLLVETPYVGWPLDLDERLYKLHLSGITTVLAHPERNGEVQRHPDRLASLVARGCLIQVTAASVDGRFGDRPRRCALKLLDLHLAHILASDAHAPEVREVGLAAAARALGNDSLARWLTDGVPRAIVDDQPIPPRPIRRRRLGRR